jgi:hypothetical protein
VPLAVAANGVMGSEALQEVLIELARRNSDQAAHARQGVALPVGLAVSPEAVIGLEDQVKVIGEAFISKFCEATRTSGSGHVSAFP